MSAGLSAGAIGLIGAVAPSVVGGILGGQSSGNTQTSQQSLDPRMQEILYGSGADKGLLGDANALRKQQLAQGGLNDTQRAGLEMQRQTLMSPQYTQGYDQMRNAGSQLLGAGVAGNPFNNGGNGSIGMGSMPNNQAVRSQQMPFMPAFRYDQNSAMQGANNPMAKPEAVTQPMEQANEQTPLQQYIADLERQQAMQMAEANRGTSS
jgi:hypothetical protein